MAIHKIKNLLRQRIDLEKKKIKFEEKMADIREKIDREFDNLTERDKFLIESWVRKNGIWRWK